MANYLSDELKTQNWGVSIDNVKPALPFKLKFKNTKLLLDKDIQITAKSCTVILYPASIFKDTKQIKFQSAFHEGLIKGPIEIIFPVKKSSLDLKGMIMPDSPHLVKFASMAGIDPMTDNIKKNGIIFTIKGTLENPKIGI